LATFWAKNEENWLVILLFVLRCSWDSEDEDHDGAIHKSSKNSKKRRQSKVRRRQSGRQLAFSFHFLGGFPASQTPLGASLSITAANGGGLPLFQDFFVCKLPL